MELGKIIDKTIDYFFLKKLLKLNLIDEAHYKVIKEIVDNAYI